MKIVKTKKSVIRDSFPNLCQIGLHFSWLWRDFSLKFEVLKFSLKFFRIWKHLYLCQMTCVNILNKFDFEDQLTIEFKSISLSWRLMKCQVLNIWEPMSKRLMTRYCHKHTQVMKTIILNAVSSNIEFYVWC